jgi:DNA ligase-4
VTLQDLHKIARQSIGRDRSAKDVDDWTKEIWGNVASPGIRSEKKRKERVDEWVETLGMVDGIGQVKNKRLKGLDSSPCPSPRRGNHIGPKRTRTIGANMHNRPVLGAKPLGLMLNLAESLPTPPPSDPLRGSLWRGVRENSDNFVEPKIRWQLGTPSSTPDASTFKALSQQTAGHVSVMFKENGQKPNFRDDLMHPISIISPPTRQIETQLPTHPTSTSNVYASRPIIKFVQDAYVWFAQPCNAPRPTWRPPTKDLLVGATRLHSLESLLAGCGWQAGGAVPSRIKRGVVFIDESTSDRKSWKEYALKTLQERHALLAPQTTRKQIWVFDAKLLGLDTNEGEVDGQAVWRSD